MGIREADQEAQFDSGKRCVLAFCMPEVGTLESFG